MGRGAGAGAAAAAAAARTPAWAEAAAAAGPRRGPPRPQAEAASSGASVREPASGVKFPLVSAVGGSSELLRCLGASVRVKKIAFVGVKVYAVALYSQPKEAARELGVRSRGGFFSDAGARVEDMCQALVDGAFAKALVLHLVRNVSGTDFTAALDESLRPRLSTAAGQEDLARFKSAFKDKRLEAGACVTLLFDKADGLEVAVSPPGEDWSKSGEPAVFPSPALGRALLEVFLGDTSPVPKAKKEWAEGGYALLESEAVRRSTSKSDLDEK